VVATTEEEMTGASNDDNDNDNEFQKSTASQGAKTLCISNMDVGCSQWGFAASTMTPQHHTGSAIPHFS